MESSLGALVRRHRSNRITSADQSDVGAAYQEAQWSEYLQGGVMVAFSVRPAGAGPRPRATISHPASMPPQVFLAQRLASLVLEV